jgi:hypothetical protein
MGSKILLYQIILRQFSNRYWKVLREEERNVLNLVYKGSTLATGFFDKVYFT